MLAWKLRQDERVVVMERTNAMHVELPEPVDVITVDVAWTRQKNILPNALQRAKASGLVLSLFKPQYEAPRDLVRRGHIEPDAFDNVLEDTVRELDSLGIAVRDVVRLPQQPRRNPEAFLVIPVEACKAVRQQDDGAVK